MNSDEHLGACMLGEGVSEKVKLLAILSQDELEDFSDFWKVFSNGTRLNILYLLEQETLCVCEIAERLSMSHSAISHQLTILRKAKVIETEKKDKYVYCSLKNQQIREIMRMGLDIQNISLKRKERS